MSYLGKNLIEHGTKFQYFLKDTYQEFMQTAYVIVPKVSEENIENEKLEEVVAYGLLRGVVSRDDDI